MPASPTPRWPRRATLLALAAAVLAQASPAPAQQATRPFWRPSPPTAATTTASGFSVERLARIDRLLQDAVDRNTIAGAVALVMRNGRVVYERAAGWGDKEAGRRMAPDAIFRIASQTKAITSLAVMMLWEEGHFQLDDPVERYIPSFAKPTVLTRFNPADSSWESRPARGRMTVRQLLTHTSGLDYADIGSDEFKAIYAKAGLTALGREGDVLAERIDRLGALPLHADPGSAWRYSLSIDVLGRLVEVWSGMPFDRFLRTRILDPLGMRDTWFELPADRRSRLVALHRVQDDVLVPWHEADGGLTHPDFPLRRVTYFSGGGGLVSTTADYARFLQLFLNGGELDGVRLLGRKTVELMLTNQVGAMSPRHGLGFGLETPDNDAESPLSAGSFAWGGAFNTTYWADPKEGLVALIVTNTFGAPTALGDPFKTFVYSALR
jgi:CubicO group peptidase (beta-lactamase class C family)